MAEETAVIEPVESAQEVAETIPENTSQPENSPKESKESTPPPDRRSNPDSMRKFLKWARENGQEHTQAAQDVERALGELKSWKTVATNVREARELRSAVDAVGGIQKIAELQTYATSMQEVDEMLEVGDPRVIDKILETGTKGIVKILPALIDKLGEADPQAISAAIQPHVTGFLDSQGLPEAIDAMVTAFNNGKPEDAKSVLAKIVSWYKGLGSKQDGGVKAPEQAAWEQEREQFHQKEFSNGVKMAFDVAMTHAEQAIDRELDPELKKYGIPADVVSIIRQDVWKRIEKERNADPLFQSTINSKINERTRKVDPSTADYLKSQTDSRVRDAVRKEIQIRYGFIKKAGNGQTKENVTAAPTGAAITIDYPKTIAKFGGKRGAEDAILRGNAVNSQGKPIVKVGKLWKLA